MTRWGMVIDLNKCVGCRTCETACHQINDLPAGSLWREVSDVEFDFVPPQNRLFLPFGCLHCQNPPCFDVCPTTATFIRPNGIVDVDFSLCIGCGYCVVACPYLARDIPSIDDKYYKEERWFQTSDNHRENRSGVATKCNFCSQRIEKGITNNIVPGKELEATPVCVAFCPAGAMHFGDLNDSRSNVSKLLENEENVRPLEELSTDASLYYLLDKSRFNSNNQGYLPLIPPIKQSVWHVPAAINFVFGGLGVGLYLLNSFLDMYGYDTYQGVNILSVLFVIFGFMSLTFEAGQPSRVIYLLRHLRRSWMSWETLMALVFVISAILNWLIPHEIFLLFAVVGAIGFLISQGMMVYNARGINSWNAPIIPFLFISSSLMTASGLLLIISYNNQYVITLGLFMIAATLLDLLIWIWYGRLIGSYNEGNQGSIHTNSELLMIGGAGHLLPVIFLITSIVIVGEYTSISQFLLFVAAFFGLIFGGIEKAGIILHKGYFRTFSVNIRL